MRQYLDTRHWNQPYLNVAVQGFGATGDPIVTIPGLTSPSDAAAAAAAQAGVATLADLQAARQDANRTALLYAGGAVVAALALDFLFFKGKYTANIIRKM